MLCSDLPAVALCINIQTSLLFVTSVQKMWFQRSWVLLRYGLTSGACSFILFAFLLVANPNRLRFFLSCILVMNFNMYLGNSGLQSCWKLLENISSCFDYFWFINNASYKGKMNSTFLPHGPTTFPKCIGSSSFGFKKLIMMSFLHGTSECFRLETIQKCSGHTCWSSDNHVHLITSSLAATYYLNYFGNDNKYL